MGSELTNSPYRNARTGILRIFAGSLIVSLVTLIAVLATLDPADCRPGLPQGPGLTLDESFNVQMGVYLFGSMKSYGLAILHPQSVEEVFGDPGYNPDHPPLGRLWLGVFHEISQSIAPVDGVTGPFVTIHARAGSACAFALTVLLVGLFAGVRWGTLAGITASACLAMMPRLFGHAHLASLETMMGLVWTVAVLGTIQLWTRRNTDGSDQAADPPANGSDPSEPPGDKAAIVCGLLIGLALLTKMQAILLPPMILVWALWHWRWRAIRPLLIVLFSSALVFVAGWPWLWLDLPGHLVEYFGRTSGRVSLKVWYLGEAFKDVDVPWHYPWVMTLVTLPAGVLLFAVGGLRRAGRNILIDPAISLTLGSVIAPLVLFSLPGVAVYDGARLFLVAFPGIALLAGFGASAFRDWLTAWKLRGNWAFGIILTLQLAGIVTTTPDYLSYYSAVVGGLPGADRLGFEATYWGDSFSREFLRGLTKAVPEGAVVQVAPVLHQFQLEDLDQQVPMLRRHQVRLLAFRDDRPSRPGAAHELTATNDSTGTRQNTEYLAVFHRRADAPLPEILEQSGWSLASSASCQGVIVASLWQRTAGSPSRR